MEETVEQKYELPKLNLCWKNTDKIRYLITFYLDVGMMAPSKIENYIARTMESYMSIWEALPQGYGVLIVPRRKQKTTIEYMDLLYCSNMNHYPGYLHVG